MKNKSAKGYRVFSIITSIAILTAAVFVISGLAITFLLLLLVLTVLYPLLLGLWNRLYKVRDIADRRLYARTPDGWRIAMHLHDPEHPQRGCYPVILAHGFAMNKYGVDLDYSHSLAYFLKQHGYTVFVLSLRGAGDSYHTSQYGYKDFSFDDIVEHDVGAVIQRARELTGAPKISWIGHSMGAMIAQGFLGRRLPGHEDIACFISLGGPGRLDHLPRSLLGLLSRYFWISRFFDFRFGARLTAPLAGRIPTPLEELIYNRDNLKGSTIRRLMKNAVENIAPGLAHQFKQWLHSGQETTRDASFDYRQGLQNISLPSLFIAGAQDRVATPDCVRFAWENISSHQKKFLLLSKGNHFSMDYCHTALVLGERVQQEVFPLILDWLEIYSQEERHKRSRPLLKT